MSLHGEIITLQCRVPADASINQSLAWKSGHKQARHDAAELANAADAEIDRLRSLLREVRILVPEQYDLGDRIDEALAPNA